MNIDGILRSVNARVVADGPRAEDGVICIGGVPLCGAASNNVRGEVVIGVDGILEGRIIGVGRGGRIRGSGLAITTDGVVVIDGGSVAPGIVQLEGAQRAASAVPDGVATAQQVGTLKIQGNLTLSETGVITLHVLGGTAAFAGSAGRHGHGGARRRIGAQLWQRLCAQAGRPVAADPGDRIRQRSARGGHQRVWSRALRSISM